MGGHFAMTSPKRRSHAPIFWLLFGAGGMLAAVLGVGLVLITGLVAPAGWLATDSLLTYAQARAFTQNLFGKTFLWLVISLFAWHALHRLFHSLHDVGIHAGFLAKLVCYGLAMAITVFSAISLLAIGFY